MSLRILSLGAHDGFVDRWLLDKFPDVDIHIDAIELNSYFAAICQTRINGECKIGAAEDAPDLFDPGSYDAVVAFELIEHVPDMDLFLSRCETMLKPGGRVYVSTPDGCFGDGSNPHHLRALRAVDLADLLRRRGTLIDMTVGSDTVTVASYTPKPRLDDIAIYCGPGWEPWHPSDIEMRGLGGSETAAVRLAESLSDLGFIVTVYGSMREDTCWRDVIFKDHTKFDPLDSRGAVIASRATGMFLFDRPIAARTRLVWVHDVDLGDTLTEQRLESIDHVLVLSRWHKDHMAQRYPFARRKLTQTRNGINLQYFSEPSPWAEREKRVLYTSSPDRGLDVLLELWPRILERVPGAELAHCYAEVYDKIADQDARVAKHRDHIRELSDQPGVVRLGSLTQPHLAALMCESRVWAHPSYASAEGAPFFETSCIGAVEAQAAGCYVVASDWGALSETVQYGARVNNGPLSEKWRDAFVNEIVAGLTDEAVGTAAVLYGPLAVADRGWDGVAEQIAKLVATADRVPVHPGLPDR